MSKPILSIIIPHYGGYDLLTECINSIRESDISDFELIIVNNDPNDLSLKSINLKTNEYIITSNYNRGYAGGCNFGSKKAIGKYLVFLNNDTALNSSWFDPLLETMESNDLVSSCQPKILNYFNRDKFDYAGGSGGYIDYLVYPFARGRIFSTIESDLGQHNDIKQIFWASGTCFITRSKIFHTMNGFDETLFAHMEEIDYHWRCQLAGYKVFSNPNSIIFHKGAQTLSYNSFWKKYYNHRNSIYLLLSNYSFSNSIIFFIPRLFLELFSCIHDLIKLKFKNVIAHILSWIWITINIKKIYRKRIENKKIRTVNDNLLLNSTIFSRSIVIDYFIRNKKKVTEL